MHSKEKDSCDDPGEGFSKPTLDGDITSESLESDLRNMLIEEETTNQLSNPSINTRSVGSSDNSIPNQGIPHILAYKLTHRFCSEESNQDPRKQGNRRGPPFLI